MLQRVDTSNRTVWDRLVQAYEFEFSRITSKEPGPDGTMALDTVLGGSVSGWLLWEDDRPAALAAVVDHGSLREVAEFYVVPRYRGHGIGRAFAARVFDRFPGAWEVKQLVQAVEAQAFWKRTLSALPCRDLRETSFVDPYWGLVVCQRFSWAGGDDRSASEAALGAKDEEETDFATGIGKKMEG